MYSYDQQMPSPVSSTAGCFDLMSPCPSSSTTHSLQRQEEIDQRLTQAFNYLLVGGACDSPTTFNNHVNIIEEMLLQSQPSRERNFDPELHSRVGAMVRDVRQQFQLTLDENLSWDDREDEINGYSLSSRPEIALNRLSESPIPTPSSFVSRLLGAKVKKDTSSLENSPVEERTFEYGGPGNEPEVWHKDSTAPTPFEDVPDAEHCHDMDQFESGTRFRLPSDLNRDWEVINQFATNEALDRRVSHFNEYVPRNDLRGGHEELVEECHIGDQSSPSKFINQNELRESINVTPIRDGCIIRMPYECDPFLQVITGPFTPSATPPASPKRPISEAPKKINRSSPGAAMRAIKKAIDASVASGKAAEAARAASLASRTSKVVTRSMTKLGVTVTVPKKKASTPQKKPKSATKVTAGPAPRVLRVRKPKEPRDNTVPESPHKPTTAEQMPDIVDAPRTSETPKSSKTIKSGTKRKFSEGSMSYTPGVSATKKKLRTSKTPENEIACPAPSQLDDDAGDPNFVQSPRSPALNVVTRARIARLAKEQKQRTARDEKGAVDSRRVTRSMRDKNIP